jgi:glyoxylase-like metal-dependent hydrolase (beta-lactamase superfamily II)
MTVQYASLYPTSFKLDGGAMFGIIPKPLWTKAIPSDDLNRIEMSLRVFLIITQNRKIIVDTGTGNYHPDKFNKRFGINYPDQFYDHLLKTKFSCTREDITDIVLTHLHFDHAGGLLWGENLDISFPNAKLHIHQKHWQYAQHPTPKDAGSFQMHYLEKAINYFDQQNQLNWLDLFSGSVLQDTDYELKFRTSHGHTPYQVIPYDQNIIYMGDLLPTSHHLHLPWVMGYDMQPGLVCEEKADFYRFIHAKNLVMIFDHDLEYWGASIKPTDKAWEYDQLYPSQKGEFEYHSLSK